MPRFLLVFICFCARFARASIDAATQVCLFDIKRLLLNLKNTNSCFHFLLKTQYHPPLIGLKVRHHFVEDGISSFLARFWAKFSKSSLASVLSKDSRTNRMYTLSLEIGAPSFDLSFYMFFWPHHPLSNMSNNSLR